MVKITFKLEGYTGYICYEVNEKLKGLRALNVNFNDWNETNILKLVKNTCGLSFNSRNKKFNLILINNQCNAVEVNDLTTRELSEMVVSIEII